LWRIGLRRQSRSASKEVRVDPISAAVIAAVAKLGEPAVKDGYEAFKALLKRKFGSGSSIASAVEHVEAKPESEGRKVVLQEEVAAEPAAQDEEVLGAARDLLQRVNAAGGGINVEASGDRAVAIGGSVQGSTVVTGDSNKIR
jgi:hypothetical protein